MDGMMEKGGTEPAGLSERPEEAGGDKSAGGGPPPQCFSAKRKLRAVSRLLRGEPLELLARELNVTAARLSQWRDRALLAAEAALKERTGDDRGDEITRLKGKVGEMTMRPARAKRSRRRAQRTSTSCSRPPNQRRLHTSRPPAQGGRERSMAVSHAIRIKVV